MGHLQRGFYLVYSLNSHNLSHLLVSMSVMQLLFPVFYTFLLCAPHQNSLLQTLEMLPVSFTQTPLILCNLCNLSLMSVVTLYILSSTTMLIQNPQSLTLNSVLSAYEARDFRFILVTHGQVYLGQFWKMTIWVLIIDTQYAKRSQPVPAATYTYQPLINSSHSPPMELSETEDNFPSSSELTL